MSPLSMPVTKPGDSKTPPRSSDSVTTVTAPGAPRPSDKPTKHLRPGSAERASDAEAPTSSALPHRNARDTSVSVRVPATARHRKGNDAQGHVLVDAIQSLRLNLKSGLLSDFSAKTSRDVLATFENTPGAPSDRHHAAAIRRARPSSSRMTPATLTVSCARRPVPRVPSADRRRHAQPVGVARSGSPAARRCALRRPRVVPAVRGRRRRVLGPLLSGAVRWSAAVACRSAVSARWADAMIAGCRRLGRGCPGQSACGTE